MKLLVTTRASLISVLWLLLALVALLGAPLQAQSLSCPPEHQISQRFDNGAGWDMCWESRKRENIVLSEISYTPPNGAAFPVLAALRLAQLHVAYDDSNVTYNDITQFGLGAGYRITLVAENCPGGELIDVEARAGICLQRSKGDDAYRTQNETILSESLTLFSTSQVGSYSYIVTWKFYADGTIAPSVGAAGALQRSTDWLESPFARQLEGVTDKAWLSHTHNYYWQMDFDMGASSTDDIVSEITYPLDSDGRRARTVVQLTEEASRKIQPEALLNWQVSDSASAGLNGPSYLIEPLHYGHKLVRSVMEPFTNFDFFVTRQDDCEQFISENAKYNPDCEENILQFINQEPLENQDITLWHRVSFHHVPRNEDRQTMHSHWDGFTMKAVNMSSVTPGHSGTVGNLPPDIVSPGNQRNSPGDIIELPLQIFDADDDVLEVSGTGLPDGLSVSENGIVQGQLAATGSYKVQIRVADNEQVATTRFTWDVSDGSNSGNSNNTGVKGGGSGAAGAAWLTVLALLLSMQQRRRRRTTQTT